ncbi:MAG: xylulokinase [Promethearchaeota archaeon]
MNEKYLLTYDLGTTGNKATLYDFKLKPISQAYVAYPIYYPKVGWAEQEPSDFWNAIKKTTSILMSEHKFTSEEIAALCFTCQMNCTIPIDLDGNPLMQCISWLDTRASELIQRKMKGLIKYKGMSLGKILFFKKHTGGGPGKNGKDPISHILWIMEYKPEIYKNTYKFLSVKDYIIFKCTNNAVTSKDLANTSWLKDVNIDDYSNAVLQLTKIDKNKLPEIKKATDLAGKLTKDAAKELNLSPGIPIFVGSGDLTSVAIGSGGILENQIIICLGTADWVAAHINERKTDIPHYIGTINSAQENYLYISKQETGAACFNWIVKQMFKDKVKDIQENKLNLYNYLDKLVEQTPPGSKNLIFAPWMFGERSPINNSEVRGGFFNLSLEHSRGDLLRSVYEGITYNIKWSLDPIEKKLGKCEDVNIIGGAANSDIWCQILSDVLERKVKKAKNPNLGGTRGSAIIAMVGLGVLKKFSEAIPLIPIDKIFEPNNANIHVYRIREIKRCLKI